MQENRPHAQSAALKDAAPKLFQERFGQRALLWICAAFLGLLAMGGAIAAAAALVAAPWFAAILAPLAVLIIALALRVVEEARAAGRVRIEIGPVDLRLILPRRRGHVRLDAVDETLPLASIVRIETRAECFGQIGVAAIQTAARLTLKDGRTLVLGADRDYRRPLFIPAAEAIAVGSGAPLSHLGMVDGAPGFLVLYGPAVPDWSAPALPAEEMGRREAARARAFRIIGLLSGFVLLARLIARR
jgi:hypothetical protein